MKPRLATPGYRLGNIEGIRGVAALMVVAAHAAGGLAARGAELGATEPVFALGAAGVDLFFVISGFVIVWSELSKTRATWPFLKNRIRRIVPLYWILTLTAAAAIALSQVVNFPTEGQDASAPVLASSMLFLSGSLGFPNPVLYQGWTLEYEMLFYVLFASTLFLRKIWVTICVASAAIVALVIFTPVSNRLIEFVLGMAVAVASNFLPAPAKWLARALFAVGVVVLFSTFAVEPGSVPYWILWGLPSALIIYGAANSTQTQGRVALELGSASYAVYLVQWFTIPAVMTVVGMTGTSAPVAFAAWGVVALVVTQAAGIVVTRFIDKPVSRLLRSKGF